MSTRTPDPIGSAEGGISCHMQRQPVMHHRIIEKVRLTAGTTKRGFGNAPYPRMLGASTTTVQEQA